MAAMRSLGFTLAAVALAAAAFSLGTRWAARGPGGPAGEVARAALADPDPIARTNKLVPLLRDLDASELVAVEEAYRASVAADGPRDASISLLAEAGAELDPTGALDRISSWLPASRKTAQEALLRAWARRNRSAALEWVSSIQDDGTSLEAVFNGWAESGDPEMWSYVAAEMEPSMEREAASIAMMQQVIAREGLDALLTRVEAIPDDAPRRFKLAAFGTATGLVADHDPERALAFADKHASGPYGDGLFRRVMVRWVLRDGPGALQHLLERPASKERDAAFRDAYVRWIRRDRAAALAWMPEGKSIDARYAPLVETYAVAVARNDRKNPGDSVRKAIAWTEQTPDTEERHKALVQIGVLYLHHEPETARSWLAEHGLEDEVRAETARYQRQLQGS